jgi:hypothetical protein
MQTEDFARAYRAFVARTPVVFEALTWPMTYLQAFFADGTVGWPTTCGRRDGQHLQTRPIRRPPAGLRRAAVGRVAGIRVPAYGGVSSR